MGEHKRIEVRWRDMDAFGHVNNAVYLTYLEEARDEWFARLLGDGWPYAVARIEIDYRTALTQGGAAALVEEVTRSSVRTHEVIRSAAGALVAEAEVVSVALDRDLDRARPLSATERESLRREGCALPQSALSGWDHD